MVAFTEIEQEVSDLAWYAIDGKDRIGHFTTGGFMLAPLSVATSREITEKLNAFFQSLPVIHTNNYVVCSNLASHISNEVITDINDYIKPSAEMSARGLYSFDNPPTSEKRDYIRVTVPRKELRLVDLPEDIKVDLQRIRLSEISFAVDSLITKDSVANL
jgi:hypothetical protein